MDWVRKNRVNIVILLICVVLSGCWGNAEEDDLQAVLDAHQMSTKPKVNISREFLYEIIQKIPSPLEISSLIKESGAHYNEDILNDVNNSSEYNNKYTQAVNLGVFGTDLGYINIYSKYAASMSFLGAVKDLADELRIGQFFDFTTISRLASNSENIDSILYISTSGFDNMNGYLKEQGRDEIAILMLVGGYVEALYVLTQVSKRYPTPELIERVGEQKILLEDLAAVVAMYKEDRYFARLHDHFLELQSVYDKVKITYVQGEREMIEVDGMLVIRDNNQSIVDIDDVTLEKITKIARRIRLTIVSTDEG